MTTRTAILKTWVPAKGDYETEPVHVLGFVVHPDYREPNGDMVWPETQAVVIRANGNYDSVDVTRLEDTPT